MIREIPSRMKTELTRTKKTFWRRCRTCDRDILTSSKYNKPKCIECCKQTGMGSKNCGFIRYLPLGLRDVSQQVRMKHRGEVKNEGSSCEVEVSIE